MNDAIRQSLQRGLVIPAHPLALTAGRKLDERRQRALSRYYLAAGAGGLAVGVHTTQFAIRQPRHGLFRPVLELAAEEMTRADRGREKVRGQALGPALRGIVRIAGICGQTPQALGEARLAADLGYHAGLLSLAALKDAGDDELIQHCRAVGEVIPLIGFYLQPSVGGRVLPYAFWRRFAEIPQVVAIKIAPFNRYQTLDVVRAVVEAGRADIALYTGNDDHIVLDLVTPHWFGSREETSEGKSMGVGESGDALTRRRPSDGRRHPLPEGEGMGGAVRGRGRWIVGGLLGHWAVWTARAVELLEECHKAAGEGGVSAELLRRSVEVTDSNAAFFDAANGYRGCIAGLHEVLRRQGLLEGLWCLDPDEGLSPGQREEIGRVYRAYPHLNDDAFVAEHRDEWMTG